MTPLPRRATTVDATDVTTDVLPNGVARALTTRFGQLLTLTHVKQRPGTWSTVVDTEAGKVFVRAATQDGTAPAAVESLRREALVAHVVSGLTPPLLAQYATSGWHVLVFGHAPGRRADLRPGSADLGPVAAELKWMARTWPQAGVPPLAQLWRGDERHVGRPPFGGDVLLHPDLAKNLRVPAESRVWALNWGNVLTGPAWAQFALLYPSLRRAGHDPDEARTWLAQFDTWRHAPPDRVSGLANALLAGTSAKQARYWSELLTP
ncbi:hypothetical protein [Embleya sp. AB8]|uniref:hypothetical protein n=1 Tax=Embleya sp. AB8 TaxID=3156304 RepID=UPI003C77556F